jgi:hypothetical protein
VHAGTACFIRNWFTSETSFIWLVVSCVYDLSNYLQGIFITKLCTIYLPWFTWFIGLLLWGTDVIRKRESTVWCYCILYLVVVIPSPFLPPRIAWPWSIATLLLGLPWFILFCQHLHVVCLTVPWVLSQPIVPDYQQSVSTRIWAVEELEMEKMYKRDRGVGLVDRNTGLVQFNRLNRTAEITMYKTVLQSCFMFLFAVLALSLSAGVLGWKYQLAAYPQLTGTANTTYFDSFGST